jgi:hypothetical protein
MKYPKGYRHGKAIQIAVRFPDDLFKSLIDMAKKEKKDFNSMVVDLAKCGKLCLDESDQHELSSH